MQQKHRKRLISRLRVIALVALLAAAPASAVVPPQWELDIDGTLLAAPGSRSEALANATYEIRFKYDDGKGLNVATEYDRPASVSGLGSFRVSQLFANRMYQIRVFRVVGDESQPMAFRMTEGTRTITGVKPPGPAVRQLALELSPMPPGTSLPETYSPLVKFWWDGETIWVEGK